MTNQFPLFIYFLETYFNQSANFEELEKLIDEFKSIESKSTINTFQIELQNLKLLTISDKTKLHSMIRKYGGRNLSEDRFKWFIEKMFEKIEI